MSRLEEIRAKAERNKSPSIAQLDREALLAEVDRLSTERDRLADALRGVVTNCHAVDFQRARAVLAEIGARDA